MNSVVERKILIGCWSARELSFHASHLLPEVEEAAVGPQATLCGARCQGSGFQTLLHIKTTWKVCSIKHGFLRSILRTSASVGLD